DRGWPGLGRTAGGPGKVHGEYGGISASIEQDNGADLLLGIEAHIAGETVQTSGVLDPDDLVAADRVPRNAPRLGPVAAEIARLVHLAQPGRGQHRGAGRWIPVGAQLERKPPGEILHTRPQAPL